MVIRAGLELLIVYFALAFLIVVGSLWGAARRRIRGHRHGNPHDRAARR